MQAGVTLSEMQVLWVVYAHAIITHTLVGYLGRFLFSFPGWILVYSLSDLSPILWGELTLICPSLQQRFRVFPEVFQIIPKTFICRSKVHGVIMHNGHLFYLWYLRFLCFWLLHILWLYLKCCYNPVFCWCFYWITTLSLVKYFTSPFFFWQLFPLPYPILCWFRATVISG